jgi:hypothetical protein
VSFGSINNTPGAGCTTYSDFTSLTASLRPGQTLPISITPGTCGADKEKMIRVFIDWNLDGDFADANEVVATSAVIAGSTAFTTNVQVPASLVSGLRTRMRIVVAETNNAASINACGTYTGGGETQDYSIQIVSNTTDLAIEDIQEPITNDCNKEAQYVSLRARNLGETIIQGTDIVYTTEVRQGANLIQTLSDTIRHFVAKGDVMILPHSQPFLANAGSYQFVSTININGDQNSGNNTITVSKTYSNGLSATVSNIQAQVCNNTSVSFRANISPASALLWYTQQTGGAPIGGGTAAFASATVPGNRTFYIGINDFKGNIGINNKEHFSSGGGYNQFSPGVRIQTFTPVEIESARLYVGNSGKVTIMVVDSASMSIVSSTSLELKARRYG